MAIETELTGCSEIKRNTSLKLSYRPSRLTGLIFTGKAGRTVRISFAASDFCNEIFP